jgi:hypothetical protein
LKRPGLSRSNYTFDGRYDGLFEVARVRNGHLRRADPRDGASSYEPEVAVVVDAPDYPKLTTLSGCMGYLSGHPAPA